MEQSDFPLYKWDVIIKKPLTYERLYELTNIVIETREFRLADKCLKLYMDVRNPNREYLNNINILTNIKNIGFSSLLMYVLCDLNFKQ